MKPAISIVVVSFEMNRQITNTVKSLTPPLQRTESTVPYEIIVVDNGSTVVPQGLTHLGNVLVVQMRNPTMSPGPAINFGLELSRGKVVGIIPDGARMVSPRLLAEALKVIEKDENSIVGTYAYHLGTEPQPRSVATGYSPEIEERMLKESHWLEDSDALFSIAVLEDDRFFPGTLPPESTATFLGRSALKKIGGMNEKFIMPGGGLVNHEFWSRCCNHPEFEITMLSGQGTFHQIHGGVSTNSVKSKWEAFTGEFQQITGSSYVEPRVRYRVV